MPNDFDIILFCIKAKNLLKYDTLSLLHKLKNIALGNYLE